MGTDAERYGIDAQFARTSLSLERASNEELVARGEAILSRPHPGRLVEIGAEAGVIYVAQSVRAPPVKIGYSTAGGLVDRLAGLQTGNPHRLSIIAQAPAYLSGERRAHKVLARYRLVGEWFEWSPKVAAFVTALKADGLEAALAAAKLTKDRPQSPSRHVRWRGEGKPHIHFVSRGEESD